MRYTDGEYYLRRSSDPDSLSLTNALMPYTCPACAPPAPDFAWAAKDCPPGDATECLDGNRPHSTFAEAWEACGASRDCAFIMRYADGRFYLRRATDPDRISSMDSSMLYACHGTWSPEATPGDGAPRPLPPEQPLLDPSLVTSGGQALAVGRHTIRVRGVRIWDNETGQPAVHVDVYDGDENRLYATKGEHGRNLSDVVALSLQSVLDQQLQRRSSYEASPSFAAWAQRWRLGQHPGLQCQADGLVSIATEIRSGRFVRDLMATLYRQVPGEWNFRGVNLGAGLAEGDDDPLLLWAQDWADRVLLVDGSEERLQRAIGQLNMPSDRWVALAERATPPSIEHGTLGDFVVDALGVSVDVVKVDIDSFDCPVTQALLRRIDTAVLVLESQPVVPPPFKFARQWAPDYEEGWLHGCSLAYQLRMLQPKYQLLLYSEHDTVFVHSDLVPQLEGLAPGTLMWWTSFPLRFPVDELDCFRRARSSSHPQGEWEELVPTEFLREWALQVHPAEALPMVAGNLTRALTARGALFSLDL